MGDESVELRKRKLLPKYSTEVFTGQSLNYASLMSQNDAFDINVGQ